MQSGVIQRPVETGWRRRGNLLNSSHSFRVDSRAIGSQKTLPSSSFFARVGQDDVGSLGEKPSFWVVFSFERPGRAPSRVVSSVDRINKVRSFLLINRCSLKSLKLRQTNSRNLIQWWPGFAVGEQVCTKLSWRPGAWSNWRRRRDFFFTFAHQEANWN